MLWAMAIGGLGLAFICFYKMLQANSRFKIARKDAIKLTEALTDINTYFKMQRDNLKALGVYFEILKKESENGGVKMSKQYWEMLEKRRVGQYLAAFGEIPEKMDKTIAFMRARYIGEKDGGK